MPDKLSPAARTTKLQRFTPRDDYELDNGLVSDPTICSQAASHTETSIEESLDVAEQQTPDDPEIPEVGAETTVNQTDSDHSNRDNNATPPTGPSIALCRAVEVLTMKLFPNGLPVIPLVVIVLPSIMLKALFPMVGVFTAIQQTMTKMWNVNPNPNQGNQ